MFVLGTAGHVDHGKSTFLKQLTGEEPDRLPEEKKRGMTIDLNFVSFLRPNGERVGIVDVPGHQRFVKNMVTGTQGMDAFLFVVAANDGWMPQSEEHLQILRFFGIERGLVIVSKTDLVGLDRVREVVSDVQERFYKVFSTQIETCLFRPNVDEVIYKIKDRIEHLLCALPSPVHSKAPRLWIDRAFVSKGVGVVGTGTLREGFLSHGDKVNLHPSGKVAVVKSIQCYRSSVEKAYPNSRVAVVLSRIEKEDLDRGVLITGRSKGKDYPFADAQVIFCSELPKKKVELAFQIGTQRSKVTVFPMLSFSKAMGVVRIHFKVPVSIRMGDRFLLRTPGEEYTLGGGLIIDPDVFGLSFNAAKGRYTEGVVGIDEFIRLEAERDPVLRVEELERKSIYSSCEIRESVKAPRFVELESGIVVEASTLRSWETLLTQACEKTTRGEIHENDLIRSLPRAKEQALKSVLSYWVKRGTLVRTECGLKVKGVEKTIGSDEIQKRNQVVEEVKNHGFLPVRIGELSHFDTKRVWSLAKEGLLVSLAEEHFIERSCYETLKGMVRDFLVKKGSASTSELRVFLNGSRKNVVLYLERMDADRLTYFKDGVRRLFRN